jgi:hypothetical protein
MSTTRRARKAHLPLAATTGIRLRLVIQNLPVRFRAMKAIPALATCCGLALSLVAPAEGLDWKRGKLERLAPLIGTYQIDQVFADPDVAHALAVLLPPEILPLVRQNLQTFAPIDFISGHLVLSGNRAHYGGEEMASVWLSVYDGTAKVILLHAGVTTLYATAERYEYLPIALRSTVASPPLATLYQPPAALRWIGRPNRSQLEGEARLEH